MDHTIWAKTLEISEGNTRYKSYHMTQAFRPSFQNDPVVRIFGPRFFVGSLCGPDITFGRKMSMVVVSQTTLFNFIYYFSDYIEMDYRNCNKCDSS